MAIYTIPEIFRPGFDEIFKLNEETIDQIVELLRIIPVGTGPKKFTEEFSSKLHIENIQQIARTIFSLGSFLESQQQDDIDNLVSDLVASYKQIRKESVSSDDQKKFETSLKRIFSSCNNLFLSFKALNLQNDNDRRFIDSRIITDIRLVFNKELENNERKAVIIHNLKLEFQKGNNSEEFFIALDNSDLKKLKENIDRAIEKEIQIRNNYTDKFDIIDISE